MKTLDVLVVNPSALSQIYQSLSRELAAIEPPIWAGLITQFLIHKNRSVELLDCEGLGLSPAEAVQEMQNLKAKLTVIVVYGQQPSASTQNMFAASLLCAEFKKAYPDRKVLLVGGHVSALPERTLLEESADFVCKGEGPQTILSLLDSDLSDPTQLKKIPGLYFKSEGKIETGPPSSAIPQEKLCTELPGVAWSRLPMKNYRAHNWHCFDSIHERQPYASIYTSLGCPFRCSFCCINAPYGSSGFRYWDPNFMIGQFDELAEKYGVRNIKIADEMFVMNKNHFLKLCQLLQERNYGFNIWAYARVDTVKPEYLETLKAAGVNWLALGIESASKHVRDGVSKGRFGQEDIRTVVRQIQNAGINVIGNFIFGLPDDDHRTMQETLDLSLELLCEMSNYYCAMAYPGSQLYNTAVEKKWNLPESWLGFSQHSYETLPLPTEHLTAQEVLRFRDEAFTKYFTDESYLKKIKDKFGLDTHRHIADMTRVTLKRKLLESP